MAYEVGKIYFVNLAIYPQCLNDPSPAKEPPVSAPMGIRVMDAQPSSKNVQSGYGHVALLLHFDPTTHLGILFLGTRAPEQPQRFVPWLGTQRMPHQPLQALTPEPPSTFLELPGYLSFSHAIRVKILQDVEQISPTIPGLCHVKNSIYQGEGVHNYVQPTQIEYLKRLHSMYWEQKRYDEDGNVVDRGGGSGGAGDSAGDSGSVGHGRGDNRGQGSRGSHGGSCGRWGNRGGSWSKIACERVGPSDPCDPSFDPIHPVTSLPHSWMMLLAAMEDYERYVQTEFVKGSLDIDCTLPPTPCILVPLTEAGLKAYAKIDPPTFPYNVLSPTTLPLT